MRFWWLVVPILLLLVWGTSPGHSEEASARLAFRVLSKWEGDVNLAFSPYALHRGLALLRDGAAGQTLAELNALLGAGPLPYRTAPGVVAAEAIWAAPGVLRPGVKGQVVNFGDADKLRAAVNGWVQQKSGGQIASILPEGPLDPQARMIITSALHFSGRWKKPFNTQSTRSDDLHVSDTESIKVRMMQTQGDFRVVDDSGLTAISLPYADGRCDMLIIEGPRQKLATAWPRLLRKLKAAPLQEVHLHLPRFEVVTHEDLKKYLQGDAPSLFSDRANLSRLTSARETEVSAVYHAARVAVFEAGTVASAASAKIVLVRNGHRSVHIDRPFTFAIRDLRSNTLLFVGRVHRP